MNIKEYYLNLETASKNIQVMINQLETQATDEFDVSENYSKALSELYDFESYVNQLLNIHKYKGFSREEYISLFELNDKDYFIINHTVKTYETLAGIAKMYSMELSELMMMNNVISDEVTAGNTLQVKVVKSKIVQNSDSTAEIPIYGSRLGENIFGRDLPNNFTAGINGDIKCLEPIECMKQGLTNRLTTKAGDYPYEDDFGINTNDIEDLPGDLGKAMVVVEVTEQLKNDFRVEQIENVDVMINNGAIQISAAIKAINKKENILLNY